MSGYQDDNDINPEPGNLNSSGYQDDDNKPSGLRESPPPLRNEEFLNHEFPNRKSLHLIYVDKVRNREKVDWNERFQVLLAQTYADASHEFLRTSELRKWSLQFAEVAKEIGVVIISELHLPDHMRTIKPLFGANGIGGGEKYIFKDIFFKLSRDFLGIYGGDEFAMKASQHELKGLMACIDCRVSGLHFPLCAIIEYRGYSLVAQSVVPVDHSTLLYGTSDGGNTIKEGNSIITAKVELLAKMLNLKSHIVESKDGKRVLMHGPADIEAHLGKDARYYILDAARLFPPVTPNKKVRGSFLCNLFRQEFLNLHPIPLSSDCFSKFGRDQSEVHNKEAMEATQKLQSVIIPQFAAFLLERYKVKSIDDNLSIREEFNQLIADMHVRGINVRYLMLLFKYLKGSAYLQSLVVTEMVARTCKHMLMKQWRNLKSSEDGIYLQAALDFFNTIFGTSEESEYFWNKEMKEALLNKFTLENGEIAIDFDPSAHAKLFPLFLRLQDKTGCIFRLSGDEKRELENIPQSDLKIEIICSQKPFSPDNLGNIEPKVKHIHRVSFEEGTALCRLAMSKEGEFAFKLYEVACQKFKDCLEMRPNDSRALYNWGLAISKQASLKLKENNIPAADKLFSLAGKKYERALFLDPTDYKALYKWGTSLIDQGKAKLNIQRKQEAEQLLQSACSKLNQAIAFQPNEYEILYNAGTSNLLLGSLKTENEAMLSIQFLGNACEKYEKALALRPNSVDALHNLAVGYAKKARLMTGFEQEELYNKSFEIYKKALNILEDSSETCEILFDWGNALYRQAVTYHSRLKADSSISPEQFVNTLISSSEKYQQALQVKPTFSEALMNWGICIELICRESSRSKLGLPLLEKAVDTYLLAFEKSTKVDGFNWKTVSFQPLIAMAQSDIESIQIKVMNAINMLASSKAIGSTLIRILEKLKKKQLIISGEKFVDDNSPSEKRLGTDWNKQVLIHQGEENISAADFAVIEGLQVDGSGFSQCLKVKKRNTGAFYAMYILNKSAVKETESNLSPLECPFLVPLRFAFQNLEQKMIYIVYDFIPLNLETILKTHKSIDLSSAKICGAEILSGLSFLLKHDILYKDLFPKNVFITTDGHVALKNTFRIQKSGDWMQAKSTFALKQKSYVVAPEMLKAEQFTEKSMFWYFGCLLFEMITGMVPFQSSNMNNVLQDIMKGNVKFPTSIPEDAKHLLQQLFRVDPKQRPNQNEIMNHPFFKNINWEKVWERKYQVSQYLLKRDYQTETNTLMDGLSLRQQKPIETLIAPEEFNRLEGFTFVEERKETNK